MPRNAGFPDGRFLLATQLANEGRPRVVGASHRCGGGLEPLSPGHVTRPRPNPALARALSFWSRRLKNACVCGCHRAAPGPCPSSPSFIPLRGGVGKVFLTTFYSAVGEPSLRRARSRSPPPQGRMGQRGHQRSGAGALGLHLPQCHSLAG